MLIYLPMVPEALVAIFATVRLGAMHSLVFGGFASNQLATRINHAEVSIEILEFLQKILERLFIYRCMHRYNAAIP